MQVDGCFGAVRRIRGLTLPIASALRGTGAFSRDLPLITFAEAIFTLLRNDCLWVPQLNVFLCTCRSLFSFSSPFALLLQLFEFLRTLRA